MNPSVLFASRVVCQNIVLESPETYVNGIFEQYDETKPVQSCLEDVSSLDVSTGPDFTITHVLGFIYIDKVSSCDLFVISSKFCDIGGNKDEKTVSRLLVEPWDALRTRSREIKKGDFVLPLSGIAGKSVKETFAQSICFHGVSEDVYNISSHPQLQFSLRQKDTHGLSVDVAQLPMCCVEVRHMGWSMQRQWEYAQRKVNVQMQRVAKEKWKLHQNNQYISHQFGQIHSLDVLDRTIIQKRRLDVLLASQLDDVNTQRAKYRKVHREYVTSSENMKLLLETASTPLQEHQLIASEEVALQEQIDQVGKELVVQYLKTSKPKQPASWYMEVQRELEDHQQQLASATVVKMEAPVVHQLSRRQR